MAELASYCAAMQRQMEPYIRGHEALWRQIEPIVQGHEALRRQFEPILQAAERFAQSGAWPVPPFQQRLIRAVEAAMREVLPPRQPVVHHVTLTANAAAVSTLAIAGVAATSGSAPMPQVRVATQAVRSIGQIFALVLLALVTSGLLGVQGPDRAVVDHYVTIISAALTVAVLICQRPK